jgi:hypothetical protein
MKDKRADITLQYGLPILNIKNIDFREAFASVNLGKPTV